METAAANDVKDLAIPTAPADRIGTVVETWKHPVKSMHGCLRDSILLTPRGVDGDRAIAVLDEETSQILTLNSAPELLHIGTFLDAAIGELSLLVPGVVDTLPWTSAGPAVSVYLGRRVTLTERATLTGATSFDYGLPVGPVGCGFADVAEAIHIVSTASMRWVSPQSPDPRRARANIVVDMGDEPFAEHGLVGRTIRIGEAVLFVSEVTERCELLDAGHPGLDGRPGTLQRLRGRTNGGLGVYATAQSDASVRPGDHVTLVP